MKLTGAAQHRRLRGNIGNIGIGKISFLNQMGVGAPAGRLQRLLSTGYQQALTHQGTAETSRNGRKTRSTAKDGPLAPVFRRFFMKILTLTLSGNFVWGRLEHAPRLGRVPSFSTAPRPEHT